MGLELSEQNIVKSTTSINIPTDTKHGLEIVKQTLLTDLIISSTKPTTTNKSLKNNQTTLISIISTELPLKNNFFKSTTLNLEIPTENENRISEHGIEIVKQTIPSNINNYSTNSTQENTNSVTPAKEIEFTKSSENLHNTSSTLLIVSNTLPNNVSITKVTPETLLKSTFVLSTETSTSVESTLKILETTIRSITSEKSAFFSSKTKESTTLEATKATERLTEPLLENNTTISTVKISLATSPLNRNFVSTSSTTQINTSVLPTTESTLIYLSSNSTGDDKKQEILLTSPASTSTLGKNKILYFEIFI